MSEYRLTRTPQESRCAELQAAGHTAQEQPPAGGRPGVRLPELPRQATGEPPVVRKRPRRFIPPGALVVRTYEEFDTIVCGFLAGTMSLLILGPAGVQKSTTIKARLGRRASYITGRATPWALYQALLAFRNKLLVLDDLDNKVYANSSAVAVLKALTEKAARKTISWYSDRTLQDAGVPSRFTTTSRAIIVTNSWVAADHEILALEDRCVIVCFMPSPAEVHRRAALWAPERDADVYEFIGAHLHLIDELSMRLYETAAEFRRYGVDWRTYLLETMQNVPDEAEEADEATPARLQVVRALLAETFESEAARVRAFVERTGYSPATYYRLRNKVIAPHGVRRGQATFEK